MSEVTGLTEDTGVVSEDENEDEDGTDGGDGSGGDFFKPVPEYTGLGEYTDRKEYTIYRSSGDPFGNPTTIEYNNGESIELMYDNDGGLMAVVDTTSGTRLINTDEGWVREDRYGQRVPIDGDVSVNKETGAIVTQLNNGMTVTANPDGRVVARNADGTLAAVSVDSPGVMRESVQHQPATRNLGFVDADFDAEGNLIGATDENGTRYQKDEKGWVAISGTNARRVDGDVEATEYGLRVVPKATAPEPTPVPEEPVEDPDTRVKAPTIW